MKRPPTIQADSDRRLDRRGFLGLAGLVAVGTAAGCSSGSAGNGGATPPPSSTPSLAATTTPSPPAAPPNWSALASKLQGTLVLPTDTAYATARQLYDFRYDNIRPEAIAYCESVSDVQRCLEVARHSAITPRPRCGGHSYGGWSTGEGLVVDVTRMSTVATASNTATVGAGARLIDLYSALASAGVALPGGSCPTVGVSGLTLGGGIGVLDRSLGLTCDRLLTVEMVTADGTVRQCAPDAGGLNADLFWASQGGGGGNFGVVTSFGFQTAPIPQLSTFAVSWPWAAAADVIAGWLSWAPGAPDEMWSTLLLIAHPGGTGTIPLVRVAGVYAGSASNAAPLVDGLVNAVGSAPAWRSAYTPPDYLSAMLYEAGCSGQTVQECHLPAQTAGGQLTRKPVIGASDYVTKPLPAAGINVIVDFVNQRQSDPSVGEGGAQFDSYGGAINRVAPEATAFAHRDALAGIQRSSSFSTNDSAAVIQTGRDWLVQFTKALRPYVSGGSYVNYQDPDLANFADAYYGPNRQRLESIKARADPYRLFTFPQAI